MTRNAPAAATVPASQVSVAYASFGPTVRIVTKPDLFARAKRTIVRTTASVAGVLMVAIPVTVTLYAVDEMGGVTPRSEGQVVPGTPVEYKPVVARTRLPLASSSRRGR